MRYQAHATYLSWIPPAAVEGVFSLPFGVGVAHYDQPPPDELPDVEALLSADAIRFANRLNAWIELTAPVACSTIALTMTYDESATAEIGAASRFLLDGLLLIEIDRHPALEVGPGAIFDPAKRIPFSKQHATIRAETSCRLAVLPRDQLDSPALLGVAAEQSARLEARRRGRLPPEEPS